MKHFFLLAALAALVLHLTGCDPKTQEAIIKTGNDILNATTSNTTSSTLSNADVIKGLKEALTVGTNNSVALSSKFDGFNKNPLIYIPWPQEAIVMKERLSQLGFQSQINDFETSLNRAAEEATKNAVPVFVNAITQMTIGDGFAILNGNDTAATHYLREKTYASLKERFLPTVTDAINKVKVTSYWSPLITNYNKIPGVQKQNPNLNNYVTDRAINGLMTLIAQEEIKIRKDPAARVTDILKKVFGAK
ncbi:MAG: hypothetical protein K0R26_443 [Bacteroidota bacterium]|jgi:hypothetical protein|nr:hypothetical protein [Bacteroidota bacterium]